MSRWNIREACLLDISGELDSTAQQALYAEISEDFGLYQQYEILQEAYSLLRSLPVPEPSASESRQIPAQIKTAMHGALHRQKQAVRQRMLICWAVIVLLGAGVCAMTAAWG